MSENMLGEKILQDAYCSAPAATPGSGFVVFRGRARGLGRTNEPPFWNHGIRLLLNLPARISTRVCTAYTIANPETPTNQNPTKIPDCGHGIILPIFSCFHDHDHIEREGSSTTATKTNHSGREIIFRTLPPNSDSKIFPRSHSSPSFL